MSAKWFIPEGCRDLVSLKPLWSYSFKSAVSLLSFFLVSIQARFRKQQKTGTMKLGFLEYELRWMAENRRTIARQSDL